MKARPEYEFKLLREKSSDQDLLEDKTHERIANTLYRVIQGGGDGITIGLEGGWGAGKSTVVSILSKKLKEHRDILYFYFDAWAHEGDPLRRVFLESLIEIGGSDSLELEDLRRKISKRKKVTRIRSKSSATGLGKCIALASFLIPLGAAMVSGTIKEVTISWGAKVHLPFLLGLFLAVAPIWVIFFRGFYLLLHPKKKLCGSRNWMFLQGETVSRLNQEVSEDEDRSSIEFERFFGKILNIFFLKNKKTKLLIVIDNLDRIDPHDSLKIWSTLQTFLQRKNPTEDNKNELYKKVWVLVPYDEGSLKKLWKQEIDKPEKNPADTQKTERGLSGLEYSRSFFDKCFQLRLEVPKQVLTGWERFLYENMEVAFSGWDAKEKQNVLEIIKLTRKSVNDIPTPRQIKTYINQVGLLRLHCGAEISTSAIAYFSSLKYLDFKSNEEIEDQLIRGDIARNSLFSRELNKELSGILFGVSPEKGYQLLLGPAINIALDKKQPETLKLLCNTHGSAFWLVFDINSRHLSGFDMSTQIAIRYSWTVINGLWNAHSDKCFHFIDNLSNYFSNHPRIDFPTPENIEEFGAAFTLLEAGGFDFYQIWNSIIELLKSGIQKDNLDYVFANKAINLLADCQKRNFPVAGILDGVPIKNWIKWARSANESEKQKSSMLVKAPEGLISEISSEIKVGAPIPDGLYDLIKYMVDSGEKDWEAIVTPLLNHINSNGGTPQNNNPSLSALEILALLAALNEKMSSLIRPIVESYQFYQLTHYLKEPGSIKYSAFLMAKCLTKDNFYSLSFPNQPKANKGVEETRSFWRENSEKRSTRASFIWGLVNINSDYQLIWRLAEDRENILVSDIIGIAASDGHAAFFNYENALELFGRAIQFSDKEGDSSINNIKECFIAFSQIEQEVSDIDEKNILKYSRELYLIVEESKNNKTIEAISVKLRGLPRTEWDKAFSEQRFLLSLPVLIKKKIPAFELENNYFDSLESFLKGLISKNKTIDGWKEDDLSDLISLLKGSFKQQLISDLTNHLVQIEFKGNCGAIKKLTAFFDIRKLASFGKDKVQNSIYGFIKDSNFEALDMMNSLFDENQDTHFNPDSHFPDVVRQPLTDLWKKTTDADNKQLLEMLALKLEVELKGDDSDIEENQGHG